MPALDHNRGNKETDVYADERGDIVQEHVSVVMAFYRILDKISHHDHELEDDDDGDFVKNLN